MASGEELLRCRPTHTTRVKRRTMAAAASAAALSAASPFPGRTRPSQVFLPARATSGVAPPSLRSRCPSAAWPSHRLISVGRERLSVNASAAEGAAANPERWLLEPVGDGDCRHIGFKVPMPGSFELDSDVVTVGRLPEKANMVIPVATVSGLHARLEKKEGNLLVTDLDSTNGTFINDKKLRPGATAALSPGSCIAFGDMHLALFRVSKLQNEKPSPQPVDSESKTETGVTQAEAAT